MFNHIDTAFEDIEALLDETGRRNTPIDAYCAGFLLIHIYATFDERVKQLCRGRCDACKDPSIGTLALKALRPRQGDIQVSNLGDTLKLLDDNLKKTFGDRVAGKATNGAWDNIIVNRHKVAHTTALPQLTVKDVRQFYTDCLEVIQEFENGVIASHQTTSTSVAP